MTKPEENVLLEQQLKEANEVQAFLNSPIWTWLKKHLEAKRTLYLAKSTSLGMKRDDRMLYMGKLAAVTEILERPGMLLALAERDAQAKQDEEPMELIKPIPRSTPSII